VIRLAKILTAVHLTGGSFTDESLQNIVLGTPLKSTSSEGYSFVAPTSLKADISNLIQRALPSPHDLANLSVADGSMIFVGMASVLSSAGLHRKKGLVMKDLIAFLIPALVQARKQGAAEMGIHPAAGLSLSSGVPGSLALLAAGKSESDVRMKDFLDSLGSIYGIPHHAKHRMQHQNDPSTNEIKSDPSSTYLSTQNALQAFGNVNLKMDVLRMCINFCEALPDFVGIVRFTSALLRVAGPGNAPNPSSPHVFVSLAKEEQIRLATAISRTVNASRKLGLQNVESDYWDDFLVRGLYIVAPPPQKALTKHRKTDLEAVISGQGKQRNPFIHDPFLKASAHDEEELIIVAGDEYEFVVTLQNPYEFEVEIPSLSLAAEGVDFVAIQHNLVLGPYRTQRFSLTGIAHTPGEVRITGCSIKIKGCRERTFPVFVEPWSPEPRMRMKSVGLQTPAHFSASRPVSSVSTSSELSQALDSSDPAPMVISLRVIPPQPLVVLSNISIPQSSLMMLEGETTKFLIKILNTSDKTPTDFFHLSFEDSATFGIRNAMSNKELPLPELHELEVQCAQRPTFRWLQAGKEDKKDGPVISPGEFGTFEIEVLGKPGLVDGVVQFDYGNMVEHPTDNGFYSRKLVVPITVTVNASIQLNRLDVLPFTCDFSWDEAGQNKLVNRKSDRENLICTSPGNGNSTGSFKSLFSVAEPSSRTRDNCLVLLDLRNAWPNPLTASIRVSSDSEHPKTSEENLQQSYTIEEVIQPGHTSRLVVVLPKIYLADPHAPIPSLNPANQRQFVVSATKFSPEAERVTRECFWYRDEFLKRVQGTWREEISKRHGELDLRGVRLSPRMVEAIKLEDISINVSVLSAGKHSHQPRQLGDSKFKVQVGEALTLRTSIYNRSSRPIYALLRVQPALAHLPHNAALDLHKKFAWSGLLQRPLPLLEPGESTELDLVAYALCSGIFEVNASVDEIIPYEDLQPLPKDGPEDNTATKVLDNLQGNTAKRVWHAAKPCTIIAKESTE
jgi:trafficking protein particle complex subunit 9